MAKKAVNKNVPAPRKKRPRKRTASAPGGNLTPKQEKFCHVYMETGNASEAYRKSYNCEKMKPESVNRLAKAQLDHIKIASRIQELKEELKEVSTVKKERLLYELEAITTSKITDYVELKNGMLQYKDFDKLTDQQIRAIEGIKYNKYGIELKLHGKSWSTERIAKLLGYEAPKKLDHTTKGDKIDQDKIIVLPANGRD